MPLTERLEISAEASSTLQSIVQYHLYTKNGTGQDKAFPDCMVTYVFHWGRTYHQDANKQEEERKMSKRDLDDAKEDKTFALPDYKVMSAEKIKHITNEMLMNGRKDQDSHSPLLVHLRSISEEKKRNEARAARHQRRKYNAPSSSSQSKSYNKATMKEWQDWSDRDWSDYQDYSGKHYYQWK